MRHFESTIAVRNPVIQLRSAGDALLAQPDSTRTHHEPATERRLLGPKPSCEPVTKLIARARNGLMFRSCPR